MKNELIKEVNTIRIVKNIASGEELMWRLNSNFLDIPESCFETDEDEVERKIGQWIYDELFISRVGSESSLGTDDLFRVSLYLSQPKNERSMKYIESLGISGVEISGDDFSDYFSWGIQEAFLDDLKIKPDFNLENGISFYKFSDLDNPMILAIRTPEALTLFHYIGYT